MEPIESVSVCVRERQREERLVYYKVLSHVLMEAHKSQGLQPTSWGPRRPDV